MGWKGAIMADVSGRIWIDEFPGWSWYRDNGTEWAKWGHFNEFNEPDQTTFAWVNQSSATVSTTYGPTVLVAPAPGGAGDNVNLRVQAAPATPYSLIVGFVPLIDPVNQTSCGVVFRESSTGKFIYFNLMFDTSSTIAKSDVVFNVSDYTNPTTLMSNYVVLSAGFLKGSIIWFKMADDGVDLTWSYSNDGQNYIVAATRSRTNFLASGPNQVGFAINSNNTSGATGMTLLSWN